MESKQVVMPSSSLNRSKYFNSTNQRSEESLQSPSPLLSLPFVATMTATTAAEEVALFDKDEIEGCTVDSRDGCPQKLHSFATTRTTTIEKLEECELELSNEDTDEGSLSFPLLHSLHCPLSSSRSLSSFTKTNTSSRAITRLSPRHTESTEVEHRDLSLKGNMGENPFGRGRDCDAAPVFAVTHKSLPPRESTKVRRDADKINSTSQNKRSISFHNDVLCSDQASTATNDVSSLPIQLLSLHVTTMEQQSTTAMPSAAIDCSASDGPILVIGTVWIKPGVEETAIVAGKLRAFMVLQRPGALWTEQGLDYQDEDAVAQQKTPEGSRLQMMQLACWQTYGQFCSFFLGQESMKHYTDNLDLTIPGTFDINQYIPTRVDRRCREESDPECNLAPSSDLCSRKRHLYRQAKSQCKKASQRNKTEEVPERTEKKDHVLEENISIQKPFPVACIIIIRIYPDPNQLSKAKRIIDMADISSLKFKESGACLRYETYRPYRSPNLLTEFLIYAVYASAEHCQKHLASMGEESLLGDKIRELSIQQPVCHQFKGNPINYF